MRTSQHVEEFTAFVRATSPQLTRSALVLAGDWHLAEDLTQATYAKVYAAWRRIKDDPLSYARRTLLRTYLSHRRLRRSNEVPSEQLTDEGRHGADHAVRLDVLAAVGTLAPADRAIVVLRYLEDRSVAETAHDLGLSEANVRTRARRALQRLRPLLASLDPMTTEAPAAAHEKEVTCR